MYLPGGVPSAHVDRFAADSGGVSKAKFRTDPAVVAEATARTRAVLEQYPVYPEIDLSLVEPAGFGLTSLSGASSA